ncbi:unnamed protein product [Rotaria socialis]|uniref:EF-hand domain-containing protein n=1 Tax=Rotaria socialis TaxID=392032 RepID=A0A821QTT0_9BILA|nr:unnamed protein product [Rotaria socialis]CAF4828430.1 unnamed protein product [Rotaria socialis]
MANDPVVAQLRPDQVQEITTAFMEFDVSRNGFITAGEMKQCLRQANIQYQDAEVDRVISNMDLNHDGNASYDEYMKFMARVYTGKHDLFKLQPPPAGSTQPSYPPQPSYGQYPAQPPYAPNPSQPPYAPNPSQPPYAPNPSQPPYAPNPSQPPYAYAPNPAQPYQQPPPASNYPPPQGQQYSQQPSNYPPRNY